MHAHVEQVDWGPVYLAAGVTTMRDVGNEADFVVAMRDALRAGRGVGPRMLLAGIIDGEGPMALGVDNATTPEDGIRLVDRYAAAGFDQIKTYSSVTAEVLRAITTAAHAKHLTVTGHVPNRMTIYDAVNAGMDQVNHITYVVDVAKDSTFTPSTSSPVAPLDSVRLRRVVAFLAEHRTVIDPTMALYDLILRPDSLPVTAVEPGAVKVAPPLRAGLVSGGMPKAQAAAAARREQNMLAVIAALHRGGVTIVAGTDQSVPGHSVHRELELYVRAGFTPMEAIQAATIVPARVMGVLADVGTVEAGKRADLLIVDGNPLARISDTRRVSLVVANGVRFEPAPLWRSVGFEP
ncbi:MAG: amidohydrolase family protein [Gemmatimonadales bacterium]|nr:amidohydrolase family protein [Gemmatimonadales bacterium]